MGGGWKETARQLLTRNFILPPPGIQRCVAIHGFTKFLLTIRDTPGLGRRMGVKGSSRVRLFEESLEILLVVIFLLI